MDYLPYDMHELIFSFILDKDDKINYAEAYNRVDLWRLLAFDLAKDIKPDITKGLKFYVNYSGIGYMFCPCGKRFNISTLDTRTTIKTRIKLHHKSSYHKRHILNPFIPDFYEYKSFGFFEREFKG